MGLVGKRKTYEKIPEETITTTAAAAATAGDQGQQLQGEKEEDDDEAEQEVLEQRKRRKIQELDWQLGLLPARDDLPDKEAPSRDYMPELLDIDTDDTAAIRRAGIDILLGLVGNSTTLDNEYESQSQKENDLMDKAEVTRRRIDAEMGLLNSARMAQMDAILGLLSPRKTGAYRS